MNNFPQGFSVGSLFCFPVGSPGSQKFYYIPTTSQIEKEGEEVKASLMSSDEAAVLSLQLLWKTDSATKDNAKTAIGERYPDLDYISLEVADMSNLTATLNIVYKGENLHSIGPKETSGADTYRVVLQDTLLKSEKEAVLQAFDGQTGILTITYEGSLKLTETAQTEINTDLAELLKSLAPKKIEIKGKGLFGKKETVLTPNPTVAECRESIENSIKEGNLTVVHRDSANISQKMKESVAQELLDDVANMLFEKIEKLGEDAQYVSSFKVSKKKSEPEQVSFDMSYTYDLAETITANGGKTLVQISSTKIPERLL